MNLRLISNASLCALLILVLHVCSANAQQSAPRSYPVVTRDTYNRVLDILFPRDDPAPGSAVFAFVLRFKPSFKPESQIVIKRGVDKVEVVEYTSLDGDIYHRLNQALARGGTEDPARLARSIRVKRRTFIVPYTRVKQWHASLIDSIAGTTKTLGGAGEEFDKTGSESIILDGTTYDLWYKQRLNEMAFSLYDAEVDTPGDDGEFKLVQWMNAVRRDVEALGTGRREESDDKREASRPPAQRIPQASSRGGVRRREARRRKERVPETAARSDYR